MIEELREKKEHLKQEIENIDTTNQDLEKKIQKLEE